MRNTSQIKDPRREHWCRQAFQNHALNVMELIRARYEKKESILRRTRIAGCENLDRALAGGRGVVVTTGHFGNWEISGIALALRGYPITTVAGEQLRPGWSDEVKKLKNIFGIDVVSPEENFRKLFNDLRKNRVLVLHIDGNIYSKGVELEFLKRPAVFPRGPAKIARIMQSPSVFAYCLRTGRDGLNVCIDKPVPPPKNDNEEMELLRYLVKKLEEIACREPEQWCIFRSIFMNNNS